MLYDLITNHHQPAMALCIESDKGRYSEIAFPSYLLCLELLHGYLLWRVNPIQSNQCPALDRPIDIKDKDLMFANFDVALCSRNKKYGFLSFLFNYKKLQQILVQTITHLDEITRDSVRPSFDMLWSWHMQWPTHGVKKVIYTFW